MTHVRRIAIRSAVLTVIAAGALSPGPAMAVHLGCTAEINPRVVQAGTLDQAFELTVYNGPQIGGPPTGLLPSNGVMAFVPARYTLKSASAPPPWQWLILSRRFWFYQGQMGLGEAETFTMVLDVSSTPATQTWGVGASDNDGETMQNCLPAYPDALDVTIVS